MSKKLSSLILVFLICNVACTIEHRMKVSLHNIKNGVHDDSLYQLLKKKNDARVNSYTDIYHGLISVLREKYPYYQYNDCIMGKSIVEKGNTKLYYFEDNFVGTAWKYIAKVDSGEIKYYRVDMVKEDTVLLNQ